MATNGGKEASSLAHVSSSLLSLSLSSSLWQSGGKGEPAIANGDLGGGRGWAEGRRVLVGGEALVAVFGSISKSQIWGVVGPRRGFFLGKMALAFSRFSYWIWGGKDHDDQSNSSLSSSPDFPSGFGELDSLKFPSFDGPKMRSPSRRFKKKWHSREERRIDREYDIVLVPSDGGCMSGSESDDSDWSIGWLEPHAPDFQGEAESSFAVLVPCYGRGRCEQPERLKTHVLGAGDLVDDNISDGKNYIEQWLSSLQNA
ncbi:uncharacterized protein [Elaeis guineensis]|uniref:Uncharacterized protein LOC105050316 isoform X2 n=1 Tax=Elaeis guineensis var. tenera TaxID=51953 RepID=A0A6I9RLA5_ELAGV|nr:uncharacterized protein LOC105050316 isoform X2 [Elaeis guineensis]